MVLAQKYTSDTRRTTGRNQSDGRRCGLTLHHYSPLPLLINIDSSAAAFARRQVKTGNRSAAAELQNVEDSERPSFEKFRASKLQIFRAAKSQSFRASKIHSCKVFKIQSFKDSKIQSCKDSKIQSFEDSFGTSNIWSFRASKIQHFRALEKTRINSCLDKTTMF